MRFRRLMSAYSRFLFVSFRNHDVPMTHPNMTPARVPEINPMAIDLITSFGESDGYIKRLCTTNPTAMQIPNPSPDLILLVMICLI
jgi:hypothetical protein